MVPIMTPTSIVRRIVRPLCYATCMVAVLCLALPARSQQDPLAPALAESDATFRTVKDGARAARDLLRTIEQDLGAARTALAGNPASPQRDDDVRLVQESLAAVQTHGAALGAFTDYADKVRAGDTASELPALRQTLGNDVAGPVRAVAGRAAGVPALAANAERYAKLAAEIAAAAGKLQTQLADLRDQSRVRSAAYGGDNDPRYRQLVEKFGKEFADASTYFPSSPRDVFRSTGSQLEPALIWDEQEEEWYRVDGSVPVETIFREATLAAGRRPTPGQLKVMAENFGKLRTLRATADSVADYVREAAQPAGAPPNRAFAELGEDGKAALLPADPALFKIKYVYDGAFRAATLDALDRLRQNIGKQGAAADAPLREFDGMLRQHNVTLESMWSQGVLPAVGDVRVVAWFADDAKKKFTSTWRFEKEKVTIALDNGYANGVRSGDVVRTEGSIPGRNCIASDERVFSKGGGLTFSSVYTCTLEDGTTEVNKRSGAGTWQVVTPQTKPASPATRPKR
jgi:hypothetical protein